MAGEALVRIKTWTESVIRTFGHDFNFSESGHAILKESSFIGSEAVEWAACTRRSATYPWVDGPGGRPRTGPGIGSWVGLLYIAAADCQHCYNKSAETLKRNLPDDSHQEPH
jgi:hypothetical protein